MVQGVAGAHAAHHSSGAGRGAAGSTCRQVLQLCVLPLLLSQVKAASPSLMSQWSVGVSVHLTHVLSAARENPAVQVPQVSALPSVTSHALPESQFSGIAHVDGQPSRPPTPYVPTWQEPARSTRKTLKALQVSVFKLN